MPALVAQAWNCLPKCRSFKDVDMWMRVAYVCSLGLMLNSSICEKIHRASLCWLFRASWLINVVTDTTSRSGKSSNSWRACEHELAWAWWGLLTLLRARVRAFLGRLALDRNRKCRFRNILRICTSRSYLRMILAYPLCTGSCLLVPLPPWLNFWLF